MKPNPQNHFLFIAIILSAIIAAVIWRYTALGNVGAYIIAITIITFSFYGYDKKQSQYNKMRVPASILHLLTLAGGTIGAISGQMFFRHKTKKVKFQIIFIVIVLAQIASLILFLKAKNG